MILHFLLILGGKPHYFLGGYKRAEHVLLYILKMESAGNKICRNFRDKWPSVFFLATIIPLNVLKVPVMAPYIPILVYVAC